MTPEKISKLKFVFAMIAAVHVFVVLPCATAYLVITHQLNIGFASDVLKYITDAASGPAGSFVWDKP